MSVSIKGLIISQDLRGLSSVEKLCPGGLRWLIAPLFKLRLGRHR